MVVSLSSHIPPPFWGDHLITRLRVDPAAKSGVAFKESTSDMGVCIVWAELR